MTNKIVPEKKCCKCGEIKPFSEFHKNSRNKDGKCPRCKTCIRGQNSARNKYIWQKKKSDPDFERKRRDYVLNYNYGISLEFYEIMLRDQNGICAICGAKTAYPYFMKQKNFFVDHDHKTGKVRGLLCYNCNKLLGMVKDDTELLEKHIKYLIDTKS